MARFLGGATLHMGLVKTFERDFLLFVRASRVVGSWRTPLQFRFASPTVVQSIMIFFDC